MVLCQKKSTHTTMTMPTRFNITPTQPGTHEDCTHHKHKIKYWCSVSENSVNKTQKYTLLILEEHQQDPRQ